MSASVVRGLVPAGKPHPATKWSLLMAMLVVVVLGVPNFAAAGQPSVQAPTGAKSGGVFTGTYTFATYISCDAGYTISSSYSNSLEGTHTFVFYGAADGSLVVAIDGGGMQLLTSCGDPFSGSHTVAASYTVTKNSSPPTPTPTPTPTLTPTPTPAPTHTPAPSPGASHTPTPVPLGGGGGTAGGTTPGTPAPVAGPGVVATPAPQPGATVTPATRPAPAASATPQGDSRPSRTPVRVAGWMGNLLGVGAAGLLIWLLLRSRRVRHFLDRILTRLRLRTEPYWFRLRHAIVRRLATIPVHGRDLPRRPGLSGHHHTGKVLAHHHTSYPALVFLLMLATILAAGVSYSTRADSSLLSLTVTGPPPTTPATIDDPVFGDHFTTSNQTIRGACPSGVFVEIWRNGSFAGSTVCDVNSIYAVLVTLVPGQNDLIARVVDALGQYGPDSPATTVSYDVPPSPTPSATPAPTTSPGPSHTPVIKTPRPVKSPMPTISTTPVPGVSPLLLNSDRHFYQGGAVGTAAEWTVGVVGGRSPYNITWQWGDGVTDAIYVYGPKNLTLSHTYSKPGIYQVTVRAKDAQSSESVLQLVMVVSGGDSPVVIGRAKGDPGNLIVIWPLLVVSIIVVLSFWLGERHELTVVRPLLHYTTPSS